MKRLPFFAQKAPVLTSLQAYSRWAASYPPQAHNALMRHEEHLLSTLLPAMNGGTALDLAGGSGRGGRLLLERGAARVISLDNSLPMLRASTLPERCAAALQALPLPACCADGVLCALAIGHLPRLSEAFAEIARVLPPGGWAVLSDFHPFAFLNGAQRTFTAADGTTYAVEHHVHLFSEVFAAAREAGLQLDAVEEARLTQADGPLPANARSGMPVVIAYRLIRT